MTEIKTPAEFFEIVLPARFKPEKAAGIDVIVQLTLNNGKNEQNWVVTIKNQKLYVDQGTNPSASLSLNLSENDFMNMINGSLSAEKAFFTGKIRFQGNIALALKLRDAGIL